jgi:CheY-like chemotaxis protein
MSVVMISSDLVISAPLAAIVSARGRSLATVRTVEQLARCVAESESGLKLVLIDLGLPGVDVSQVVGLVRARQEGSTRIVAFGPHVQAAKLAAAAEAGCDKVLARGQFVRQMEQIVGAA